MSIILVRHTTLAVESGICYGATDIDVAESFDIEAQQVVAKIHACDALTTSPLQRCTKLAQRIAIEFGIEPVIDERIVEMDFGAWEGQAWADIPRVELNAWSDNFLHARPHGGESVATLRARVLAAVEDYRTQDGTQVLVCHAGVIKAALATGDESTDFNAVPNYGDVLALN